MNPAPGELPATLPLLQELRVAGALDDAAFNAAVAEVRRPPTPQAWARFGDRLLASLGGTLLATSVIYLVAWNWDDLDRVTQLVMLQALLVVSAGTALWRGAASAPGSAGLITAFLVCGAQLAFFGQTWQTGKDPWELFALWALLTLPWAVAARSPTLWVLEGVLANLAFALYWNELVRRLGDESSIGYVLAAGVLNGLGWCIGAIMAWRGLTTARWPAHLWLFVSVTLYAGLISTSIFLPRLMEHGAGWAVPGLVVLLGTVVLLGAVVAADAGALAIGSLGVVMVSGALLGKFAWDGSAETDDPFATVVLFVLVGLILTAEIAGTARLIAWIVARRRAEAP